MLIEVINIVLGFIVALVLHELGHLFAARVCRLSVTEAGFGWGPGLYSIRVRNVDYVLRLVPLGAYVKMDMAGLQRRPLVQQLFILSAGIGVNLFFSAIAWGTPFGTINLALTVCNLLPLYQQDGWKAGMVICRRVFGRPMPLVEWSFTIFGGLMGLFVLARALTRF